MTFEKTYSRIFPAVLVMSVLAKSTASIELYVKLVVISAGTIHVHTIGIVRVACN